MYKKRSFYPSIPSSSNDYVSRYSVDKDPFYRTNDILNGVYRKNIRLVEGNSNATDLSKIYLNYGEMQMRPIVGVASPPNKGGHTTYRLACGHEWTGNGGHTTDGSVDGACAVCGAEQTYLAFQHEWQHIIFRSDLAMRKLFVDGYVRMLKTQIPEIDDAQLDTFLHLLINVFDDIRCNSLWERVYRGSARDIWNRWRRLVSEQGDQINTNFLSYCMAIGLGIPTNPNGEFECLRPLVEWGMWRVRGRGFPNMLIDIRVVIERCMAVLADRFVRQQQQQGGQSGNSQDQDKQAAGGAGSDPQESGGQQSAEGDSDGEGESSETQRAADGGPGRSASASVGDQQETSLHAALQTLSQLIDRAGQIDPVETHLSPTADQLDALRSSHNAAAALNRVLQFNTNDDQALATGNDVLDPDVSQALSQLMKAVTVQSEESTLTGNTKARTLLINVTSRGVTPDTRVVLDPEEKTHVRRMRSAFFKALGRQRFKHGADGVGIDVQALIEYRLTHEDPDIFDVDSAQRGFAYNILCDMSGSMSGVFHDVCHAAEMLKEALHFPFVVGQLWGFRGGQAVSNRASKDGEVWVYRYARDVKGYTGTAALNDYYKTIVPVSCGGLTPMNPAIRIVTNHLSRRMPEGMAKRIFLLTDGSPCSSRTDGSGHIPEPMLRSLVAKEINHARRHGIQVYTIVIGPHSIPEDQCRYMFGMKKYWRRVSDSNTVGDALSKLVLDNFQRYIKSRG